MNSFLYLAAFLFWGLFWIEDPVFRFITCIVSAVFILCRFCRFRFRRIFFVVWVLLAVTAMSQFSAQEKPEPAVYVITEIRSSYAIGRNETKNSEVVIYQPDNLVFGDRIRLEEFEEIHSLNNPGVFSFERNMKKRGICFSADARSGEIVSEGGSVRSRIYRFLRERFSGESAENRWKLCRMFLYSIPDAESSDWVFSLGLPLLGLGELIRMVLKRWHGLRQIQLVLLMVYLLYGTLFIWNTALLRITVFTFFRWVFAERRNLQLPFAMIAFLLLEPAGCASFAFALPVLMSLLSKAQRYGKNVLIQKSGSVCLLVFLQALWFGRVSFLMLLGYRPIRKLYGFLMLAGCLSLMIPDPSVSDLLVSLMESGRSLFKELIFYGRPGFLCTVLFSAALIFRLLKPARKSAIALMLSVLFYFVSFRLDPFFHVYQLDIGQGDCAVIVEPFMKSVVMIDAAGHHSRDNARRIIIPFLQAHHISEIDALIVTHDDSDHSGAVGDLKNSPDLQVKKIITGHDEFVPVNYPFYSLLPQRQAADSTGNTNDAEGEEDRNDQSIVSYFAFDQFAFLWMGDASSQIEQQLVERYQIRADVLKAGHHGSKTSSSAEFLREIEPELTLISAGRNNRYGHPHIQSLKNLKKAGSDVLSTAQDGAISLSVFRNLMFIQTESGLFSWLIRY